MPARCPEQATMTRGFVPDADLGYASARRRFRPGEQLAFDPAYRLAHLPLVAPGHPKVIAETPGKDYRDGRYAKTRYAVVIPVADAMLASSPAFGMIDAALREASFSTKLAWNLLPARTGKLHATLVGGLDIAEADAAVARLAAQLPRLGPFAFRLGGPMVGDRNFGRIYFPAYPERVAGDDPFAHLQEALDRPRSRFYGVGYYNFLDEPDMAETAELAAMLTAWEGLVVAEAPLSHLEVLATNDDLALSGRTIAAIDPVGRVMRHAAR
jgi:hypothetical protein